MQARSVGNLLSELDVARFWWSLPPGCLLPLHDGACYRLLFSGRPGGAAGPDVRDAVLQIVSGSSQPDTDRRICGDVEFHLRAPDWFVHQHHLDRRYNHVLLHVVALHDARQPTLRQDGSLVPVCVIGEVPLAPALLRVLADPTSHRWPCQQRFSSPTPSLLTHLRSAGILRFEQKTAHFVEKLHQLVPSGDFDPYDECLLPALAEALGYGRDREFFHAVGVYLLRQAIVLPEPLGRSPTMDPLDAGRLHALATLVARWRIPGIWRTIRPLCASIEQPATTLSSLRRALCAFGLSVHRVDILLCNVVLPYAAAVALVENQTGLAAYMQAVYLYHPGLPSNQVTRAMCHQLRLTREPRGSCVQQGLHYIYQQTCREKRCDLCILGKQHYE